MAGKNNVEMNCQGSARSSSGGKGRCITAFLCLAFVTVGAAVVLNFGLIGGDDDLTGSTAIGPDYLRHRLSSLMDQVDSFAQQVNDTASAGAPLDLEDAKIKLDSMIAYLNHTRISLQPLEREPQTRTDVQETETETQTETDAEEGSSAGFPVIDLAKEELPSDDMLSALLLEHGQILLRNAPFDNADEFDQLFQSWLSPMRYLHGTNEREELSQNILSVGTEPPHLLLRPHNEMAYADAWPRLILFACMVPTESSGVTMTTNNREVTRALSARLRDKFKQLGVMYIRRYTDETRVPAGSVFRKHWQSAFYTDNKSMVEEQCRRLGYSFEWEEETGALITRYLRPAFVEHPITGEELFFTSLLSTNLWFDEWEPWASLPRDKRPEVVNWGDGSSISEEDLQELQSIYDRYTTAVPWQKHDIKILENMLTAHGRTPYDPAAERVIFVSMGNRVSRKELELSSGVSPCGFDEEHVTMT